MSRPIRAVIFDVGGVLVRTLDHSGRLRWEQRLGLEPGRAEAIVLNSEMGHRAQRGEITDAELWAWVNQHLQLGDKLEAFRDDFWRGDTVDPELVDLVRRLRPRYQMAIISNATGSLDAVLRRYGLREEFDLVVGSATEGVMKPNPIIYERTLARLRRIPEEAVLIDDAQRNLAGARAVGLRTIHYTPGLDVEAALRRIGVEPDAPNPVA